MLQPENYRAKYYAHQLSRAYASDHVGKLAGILFDAQVEPKPHQIDAALFALKTPFLNGVILADEVGLGKTIEAGIVISQYWAERKNRILIIAPSSLRQQWKQELEEKFAIPAELLDRKTIKEIINLENTNVWICSYEFVNLNKVQLSHSWDLVICDEAHRLRSYWNGKAKIAKAVASISQSAAKTLMLTATPLQNRLEELYGLVSVFDPNFFHSLEAFRNRYIENRNAPDNQDLKERVSLLAKRALRKDVNKYIRFTTRTPMTFAFTPSEEEIKLYGLVNSYLQRSQLWAFKQSQRHLSSLIIRKRLGSSSYALASTLENVAERLETEAINGVRRNAAGGILFDLDVEEEIKEAQETFIEAEKTLTEEEKAAMMVEAAELKEYASLARSITVNQKAVKLIESLTKGFEKLREIGAPEKAIIFTDSTVTQNYIAKTLRESGWGEDLILFNGANNSPEANAIYRRWLEENQGSDLITGIASADRRKALVDAFRDSGKIMIATEAAAEGINLQFCSMLVNYDLPWNPQRVEQRIGRVHRFGQKHNVIVFNYSNKGNRAEERILELLTEKFQLFTSVFGASDEVLGQIEDGLDFEKSIVEILERCKTPAEIDAAFNELEKKYSKQISREMQKTRTRVFENLDPKVRDKLKTFDVQTGVVLNAFERMLFSVTQHELAKHAVFHPGSTRFTLKTAPTAGTQTGEYYFKSTPVKGAHQYRYAGRLCEWVISEALNSPTPDAELTFSLKTSERVSTLAKKLKGKTGVLTVESLSFEMEAGKQKLKETYLLMAGNTALGEKLDEEEIKDILELTCIRAEPTAPICTTQLNAEILALEEKLTQQVTNRNAEILLERETLIEAERRDYSATVYAKVDELEAKENTALKESRRAGDMVTKLKHIQEARKLRTQIEEIMDEYRQVRNKLREESTQQLAAVADALNPTQRRETLFTIRWVIQ